MNKNTKRPDDRERHLVGWWFIVAGLEYGVYLLGYGQVVTTATVTDGSVELLLLLGGH